MCPIRLKLAHQILLFTSTIVMAVMAVSAVAEDTAPFWVLGSYSKADNAHSEQARLSEVLGIEVEIRFD